MRRSNLITALLVIIVLALLMGLVISVYYVFFSDESGFLSLKNKQNENVVQNVIPTGRTYTRNINGKEYTAEIYKDGTMGLSIYTDGTVAKKMQSTLTLTGSVDKTKITNVYYAYEVKVGSDGEYTLVVVKVDGTVWKLNLDTLYKSRTDCIYSNSRFRKYSINIPDGCNNGQFKIFYFK